MKPNLRCKRCGNVEAFSTCQRVAKWDKEKEKWQPKFLPREFIICDKCNSTEIEEIK